MTDPDQLNRALRRGDELAEQLIENHGLNRDDYEHDLFYGNPDLALWDILEDLLEAGAIISKDGFDDVVEVVSEIRGVGEGNDVRHRYQDLTKK